VALVASGIGSAIGLGTGLAAANRPIVQTIGASQPTRIVKRVFHPSANQHPEIRAVARSTTEAPLAKTPESPVRGESPRSAGNTAVTAAMPAGRGAANAEGIAERPRAIRAERSAAIGARREPKRVGTHFGQSEIVDPWGGQP
jgi:hypothetical protein